MKKIPKFKSEEEAARFWGTHSFEEYQADTKEAGLGFVKKPKKTVALRLDPADIKSVEAIARTACFDTAKRAFNFPELTLRPPDCFLGYKLCLHGLPTGKPA